MAQPIDGRVVPVNRPIPIENVYYLFCYAWDRFREAKAIGIGRVASPKLFDLFASVLLRGINQLVRRGLDRGYADVQDDLSMIRGRIVVGETIRRNLLVLGRARCRFDDLSYDTVHNQIIKATLYRLLNVGELDAALRREAQQSARFFSDVSDVSLSTTLFRRVQLSRNNGNYDLLIKICQLMHSELMPHERGMGSKFSDPLKDDKLMAAVFELFVRNFYRAEQTEFSVKAEPIQWDAQELTGGSSQYLPEMRTDVTLRSKERTIVIDTKYYAETLAENNYGQKKVRSDHLYQLYAYLKNCKSRVGLPEGILLYPTTSQPLDLGFLIGGHQIRVVTLKLDQSWQRIHAELCRLLIPSNFTNLPSLLSLQEHPVRRFETVATSQGALAKGGSVIGVSRDAAP
jgi:5-methylcytosine-specific restriction enzyme subunit McrC